MALGKEVDGATITRTLQEMEKVDADCDAAQRSIDTARGVLDASWHGAAKNTFVASLEIWQQGLNDVKRGLADLNTAMTTFYSQSVRLEEDRSRQASWT